DATQHVDLIFRGILLFAVQMLFTGLALGSFHGDGFGRTGKRAESASGAAFATLFITIQNLKSAEYFRKGTLLLRILNGSLLLEEVLQRDRHPLKNPGQVQTLPETERLSINLLCSLR